MQRLTSVLLIVLATLSAHAAKADDDQSKKIHADFKTKVLPILARKCFACHDGAAELFLKGWGWRLNVLATEQKRARSIIDMSHDLGSDVTTPRTDLWPLLKIMASTGAMPPADYTRVHPEAKTTDDEKAVISAWVDQTLAQLAPPEKPAPTAAH